MRSDLTEFQQRILAHMLRCDSVVETVSHISEGMGALQPAVFRATKTMEQRSYLEKIGGHLKGKKKEIILTDKAIASLIAIYSIEDLAKYLLRPRGGRSLEYNIIRYKLFDTVILLHKRSSGWGGNLEAAIRFMLVNEWFDRKLKVPDHEEMTQLLTITTEFEESTYGKVKITKPEAEEVETIAGLLTRFRMDAKRYIKMVLVNYSLRLSLDEFQIFTQFLLYELSYRRRILTYINKAEHELFIKDVRKIVKDVETAKKLLEYT